MSGVKDISRDLDKLDDQLDDLEDALEPLLGNLEELSSQLPLLDKAKLFSLAAYSIESLLFSSLKLQGTDALNHPVYAELKRVQQYFAKIKAAEEPEAQRTTTVNKEAAARVLKADLVRFPMTITNPFDDDAANISSQSDNKSLSSKLAEKIAEERAKALLKSFDKKRPAEEAVPKEATGPSEGQQGKRKKKQKHKGKDRR
ncbi:Exosome complex protein [Paramyrothecium foliicola]|nr:Exosome complex protein [Paramyrothecium foliicola]